MHTHTHRASRFLHAPVVAGLIAVAAPAWAGAGQPINEDLKLLAADGVAADWFGWSVAIDDGIVAVGINNHDGENPQAGTVYLFDASTGAAIAALEPDNGMPRDQFGWSVAIDNGVIAVGAILDNTSGNQAGAAFLFDANSGTQIAKLLPNDPSAAAFFGFSIAIDDGIVGVGVPFDDHNGRQSGSAYLFDVSTGDQIAKLLPSDGETGDAFGVSIAIGNGIVAVGANEDDDNGFDSGAAYLFDALSGTPITKLHPSDGALEDHFGISIAIDDGIIAVGADHDRDNGIFSGSAYLFDVLTGAQLTKLLPNDGAAQDFFGLSIAIDNGIVAVGARTDGDSGFDSGSAYLFDVATGDQIAKLLPSDGAANDQFGISIAIDNGVVAVGAYLNDDLEADAGAAYVFGLCRADFNGDGTVNTLDFIAYFNAFNESDPRADMNGDGVVNTLDFLAFLNAFNEGC